MRKLRLKEVKNQKQGVLTPRNSGETEHIVLEKLQLLEEDMSAKRQPQV